MTQLPQEVPFSDVDWKAMTAARFWQTADEIQESTLKEARLLFSYLENAEPGILGAILLQYRHFTVYYIPDLALLIARLDDGGLRSFLADVLYDELGSGDPARAHPRLYDDFLTSIGVCADGLNETALLSNVRLLDDARKHLIDPRNSNAFAVGLRGMGGECVCQVYIAQLYESLIKNPFIRENWDRIDWRFWDLHVGEHDLEHRDQTRALIDSEIVSRGAQDVEALGHGYVHSMRSWRAFWENIFKLASPSASRFPRAIVEPTVNVMLHPLAETQRPALQPTA